MNHPGEFSSLVLDYQLVAAASGNKILESNRPGEGAGCDAQREVQSPLKVF